MRLQHLISRYTEFKGLSDSSIEYYRRCVNQFERHLGREAQTEDFSPDCINRWLWSIREKAPHYRKSLRTGLVALWRFAAAENISAECSRVAGIRISYRCPNSWSPDDVSRLRSAAARLTGYFRETTIPRGPYFHTLIGAAWYLGLSQVDLHKLTLRDFVCGGQLALARQKTGQKVTVGLPTDEFAAIEAFATWQRGDAAQPVWPLWGTPESFRRQFAKLVDACGLDGSWKTLRASAGTAYELAHPGHGHAFLGNTRDVFMRSYYDPRRQPTTLPHAPRLKMSPSEPSRGRQEKKKNAG